MPKITRLYDFQDGQRAYEYLFDDEFNQIVDLLNGMLDAENFADTIELKMKDPVETKSSLPKDEEKDVMRFVKENNTFYLFDGFKWIESFRVIKRTDLEEPLIEELDGFHASIASIEEKNEVQDTRLSSIEEKNEEQDTRLSLIEPEVKRLKTEAIRKSETTEGVSFEEDGTVVFSKEDTVFYTGVAGEEISVIPKLTRYETITDEGTYIVEEILGGHADNYYAWRMFDAPGSYGWMTESEHAVAKVSFPTPKNKISKFSISEFTTEFRPLEYKIYFYIDGVKTEVIHVKNDELQGTNVSAEKNSWYLIFTFNEMYNNVTAIEYEILAMREGSTKHGFGFSRIFAKEETKKALGKLKDVNEVDVLVEKGDNNGEINFTDSKGIKTSIQVYDDTPIKQDIQTLQTEKADINHTHDELHEHINKETLDKLSDDGTNLLFNGKVIQGGTSGSGEGADIDDEKTLATNTWSAYKINQELEKKAAVEHTHPEYATKEELENLDVGIPNNLIYSFPTRSDFNLTKKGQIAFDEETKTIWKRMYDVGQEPSTRTEFPTVFRSTDMIDNKAINPDGYEVWQERPDGSVQTNTMLYKLFDTGIDTGNYSNNNTSISQGHKLHLKFPEPLNNVDKATIYYVGGTGGRSAPKELDIYVVQNGVETLAYTQAREMGFECLFNDSYDNVSEVIFHFISSGNGSDAIKVSEIVVHGKEGESEYKKIAEIGENETETYVKKTGDTLSGDINIVKNIPGIGLETPDGKRFEIFYNANETNDFGLNMKMGDTTVAQISDNKFKVNDGNGNYDEVATKNDLSGFAPSGFGLGTDVIYVGDKDLNTLEGTGFFYASPSAPNIPGNSYSFYYILQFQRNSNYKLQFAISSDRYHSLIYKRISTDNIWGSWFKISNDYIITKNGTDGEGIINFKTD